MESKLENLLNEIKAEFETYLNDLKFFYKAFSFNEKYDTLADIDRRLKRLSDGKELIETTRFMAKLKVFDAELKISKLKDYLTQNKSITAEILLKEDKEKKEVKLAKKNEK